ncbi:hypothetical protein D3C83_190040 [compost metagenome]
MPLGNVQGKVRAHHEQDTAHEAAARRRAPTLQQERGTNGTKRHEKQHLHPQPQLGA